MSEPLEDTREQDTETAERPFLVREFTAELTPGDGRTVDVRIVPYGVPAQVSDNGGRTVYREEWDAGCFDDQLVAGHRLKVLLNFEHLQGISNIVGRGVALRSEPDGLHGSFRISETPDGDKALELVNDGILDGVSLEAIPKRSVRTEQGVVRRLKAHLHNVALCRRPTWESARVLAVREQVILDEQLLPVEMNEGLVERLRAQGFALPDRYQTHPAETDTPSNGEDTPEAAPVDQIDTTSSEENT